MNSPTITNNTYKGIKTMQSIHKTKKNIQILKEATNLIIIEPPTLDTQDDLQEFAELDKEYDRISKLRLELIHRLAAKSHAPSESELIGQLKETTEWINEIKRHGQTRQRLTQTT